MRGKPATIKCRECKATQNLFLTGRSKTVAKYGNSENVTLVEVKHTGINCARVFWSNHPEAKSLPALQPELRLQSAVG